MATPITFISSNMSGCQPSSFPFLAAARLSRGNLCSAWARTICMAKITNHDRNDGWGSTRGRVTAGGGGSRECSCT